MKNLLCFFLCLAATGSLSSSAEPILKDDAIVAARKLIISLKPTLELTDASPVPYFVPAGPSSGGGPKWVIGFTAQDTKTKEKDIYYVTVFPDGKTDGQVRMGPRMGGSK
jgi:hypothetical protein